MSEGQTLIAAVSTTEIKLNSAQFADAQSVLAQSAAFKLFDPADLAALAALAAANGTLRLARYSDASVIVREGDPARHLLIIRQGRASVLKRSESGGEHEVNQLEPGSTIGELAMIDPAPRSATVRAIGPVEVLAIPINDILALAADRPSFALALIGVARHVAERLRTSTSIAVESLERALEVERTRTAMGKFTFLLIVAYSLYTWVLGTAAQVKQALGRSELVTVPVILVTAGILVWFMKSSGYPPRFFGLTLKHAPRQVLQACALTLPWMALVVALKWWMVGHVAAMQGQPLIQMFAPATAGAPASTFNPWLTLAYVVFVPFQELIYRGGLQGALEHFLTGRWRRWMAIFGSNIIFSAAHLYISPGLSVTAFIAGLFWGWLYSWQRGLAGVSVSHIVLGFWAFEVVDLGVLE